MKYYLAYGSNLNVRQMMHRCPGAKPVGTMVLEGYELLFKGSKTGSYLTIEKKIGGKVPVGIWQVSEQHEKALDRYEGFPVFYYKKEIPITEGKPLCTSCMRTDLSAFQANSMWTYVESATRILALMRPTFSKPSRKARRRRRYEDRGNHEPNLPGVRQGVSRSPSAIPSG